MTVSTITPIEILQNVIDECCDQHDQCLGCKHIRCCIGLWDKLSEQITNRALSLEQMQTFLDDFKRLWRDDDTDILYSFLEWH
jgi:hypothetical protein